MKDIMGREISEGKTVVTTLRGRHLHLRKAVVVGFTTHKVKIEATDVFGGRFLHYKYPQQLALV